MKLFSGNCGYILLTVFACLAVEGHYYNDHRDLLEEASGGRTCGTNIPTDEDRAQAAEVSRKWAATKLAFTDVQIEVFVHVITDSSGDGALAMVNITASMDHLNNAYSGTGFSFVLKGATCTENDAWYNSRLFSDEVAEMKSSLREGNEKTLNIYFKKLGGILGYAVFPVAYTNSPLQDGIVMRSDQYAGSDSARFGEGDTLVHEM